MNSPVVIKVVIGVNSKSEAYEDNQQKILVKRCPRDDSVFAMPSFLPPDTT